MVAHVRGTYVAEKIKVCEVDLVLPNPTWTQALKKFSVRSNITNEEVCNLWRCA